MLAHYQHIEQPIKDYFDKIGYSVKIEPSGSRGPDILSDDGSIVGEIKHTAELARDLSKKFWHDWNDPSQKFGGKNTGETLVELERLGNSCDMISAEARGFVATILGQLKHGYVMKARLDNGWLVVEDVGRWKIPLNEALTHIASAHRGLPSEVKIDDCGIGYVNIRFI